MSMLPKAVEERIEWIATSFRDGRGVYSPGGEAREMAEWLMAKVGVCGCGEIETEGNFHDHNGPTCTANDPLSNTLFQTSAEFLRWKGER